MDIYLSKDRQRERSSPGRHRRVSPDRHPRPFTAPRERGVKLGTTYRDGPPIGQRHGAPGRIHGSEQVPLSGKVVFDEQLDVAHVRTTALSAAKVKVIAKAQSQQSVVNPINSIEKTNDL